MELSDIKKYLNSETGKATREYLQAKCNILKNIENISEKDTTAKMALEVKAQKRAYKLLKEILEEIMMFTEEIKPKDPRDRYDVGVDDEK